MTKQNKKQHLITAAGLEELKKEYQRLVEEERPRILAKVAEMRSLGDLKENAAYQEARRKQAFIEGRIKELEYLIQNAVISTQQNNGRVQLGSRVKLRIVHLNEEQELTLVGENEGNLLEGKISVASPLGQALLEKNVGTKIEVEAPAGTIVYEILEIN